MSLCVNLYYVTRILNEHIYVFVCVDPLGISLISQIEIIHANSRTKLDNILTKLRHISITNRNCFSIKIIQRNLNMTKYMEFSNTD